MSSDLTLLHTRDLQTGYLSGSRRTVITQGPLDLEILAGQLICLLGPNGAGKSTLLRTLAGLQPALQGSIEIEGEATKRLTPVQLAKKVSLVLTDRVASSNLTVYSLVALGRYPYSSWLGLLSEADKSVIEWAVSMTGIESLIDRKMHTLSDGENQKVMLARALAQDTPILMLDEPTAHLDLPSRIQLMRLLHRLARQTHKGILLSTHELDLALQVAGEVWLLQPGGQLHRGAPEDLVLNGVFEEAFVKDGVLYDKAAGAFIIHSDNTVPITLTGTGVAAFWTQRALQRQGFVVNTPEDSLHTVHVSEEGGVIRWRLEGKDQTQIYGSIGTLLNVLRFREK
jgi:iron complex transport system ATP-binding protein